MARGPGCASGNHNPSVWPISTQESIDVNKIYIYKIFMTTKRFYYYIAFSQSESSNWLRSVNWVTLSSFSETEYI